MTDHETINKDQTPCCCPEAARGGIIVLEAKSIEISIKPREFTEFSTMM